MALVERRGLGKRRRTVEIEFELDSELTNSRGARTVLRRELALRRELIQQLIDPAPEQRAEDQCPPLRLKVLLSG